MASQSKFFREVLGAPFRNDRWSWGAVDEPTRRVFLRVWSDEIHEWGGSEWIRVWDTLKTRSSPGYTERRRHIDLIRGGYTGWGVLVTSNRDRAPGTGLIESCDSEVLLSLGDLRQEGARYLLRIDGRVPLDDVLGQPSVRVAEDEFDDAPSPDATAPVNQGPTTSESLVASRIGQGRFRDRVLAAWGGACCVSGSTTTEALRASHIKPWSSSSDLERLDPDNGLPLLATFDALFDRGLITFTDAGKVRVSKRVSADERSLLGVESLGLRAPVNDATKAYLAHHRKHCFDKS